jgi:hypothetical protein
MGSASGVLRILVAVYFTVEQIVRDILFSLAYAVTPMFSGIIRGILLPSSLLIVAFGYSFSWCRTSQVF